MDRRKTEAQSQLKKLKEECQITVGLLNKLIDVCTNHVTDLEKLDSRDFRLHSKYFLAVSQFQYLSHQKLLELNVDLEEHIFERDPPNLHHFKLVNCTASSPTITVARESESSLLSPTTSLVNEPLQLKLTEINNKSNEITDLLDLKIESNEHSLSSSSRQNNNQILYENNVRDTLSTIPSLSRQNSTCKQNNINNDCYTKETMSQTCSTSTLLDTREVNGINNKNNIEDDGSSLEYFCCSSSSNLNESRSQNGMEGTKSDESFYSQVSFEADLSQLESSPNKVKEPEHAKSSKITEQLKSLPLMSLEEKFMKCLPKAPMPDLSLRPTQKKTGSVASNVSNKDLCKKEKIVLHKLTVERPLIQQRVEILEIKERVPPKLGDICMIGYMETPSQFYIQVADENIELIDLWPIQLESIFGNSAPLYSSKTETMNKMGNFCCIKCDNFWYRAQVLDWKPTATPDKEAVLVQLIDYGNTYVANYTELRPLLQAFCHVPKMAQLCHLAYLHPPGSTNSIRLREWPEESLTGFYNMCGNLDSNIFKITHVYKCEARNSFELDIVNADEQDEEKSIGHMLVESGFAVPIFLDNMTEVVRNHNMAKQIRAAHGLEGIQPNMSEEEIWDKYFEQNVDFEPMSISEKIMHCNPRDEAETCKNLRPDGTCYKGTRCKLRHTPLKHGFTRDKEAVYERAFNDAPLLSADDEIELTISHIVDIQCFYAQLRQRDEVIAAGLTINSLIKEMNNTDTVKNYEELKNPPSISQLVIAKHWNEYWYRAQVRCVYIPQNNAETLVEVYFVDFGDRLEVSMSNLRVILPDFLNIPFQATECRLFNVRHKEGMDEADEKRHFESRYLGQNFRATIVAIPGHLEVLLKNDKDEDVGLKLIEDGYGELNTEHNFPAENEMILID